MRSGRPPAKTRVESGSRAASLGLVAWLFAAIVAAAPFPRGLWFEGVERYILYAVALVAALFVVPAAARRGVFGGRPPGGHGPASQPQWTAGRAPLLIIAVLAILYGLAVIWAVDRRAALDGFLNHAVYAAFAAMAWTFGRGRHEARSLVSLLAAAAGALALFCLGEAFGLYHLAGDMFGARAAGPFQYPNVLGVFSAAGSLVALGLDASAGATGVRAVSREAIAAGTASARVAATASGGAAPGRAAPGDQPRPSGLAWARLAAVLQIVVLMATSSRGALLSFLGGAAILGFAVFRNLGWTGLARVAWLVSVGLGGGLGVSAALGADARWLGALLLASSAAASFFMPVRRPAPASASAFSPTPGAPWWKTLAPALVLALVLVWGVTAAAGRAGSVEERMASSFAPAAVEGPPGTGLPPVDRLLSVFSGDLSLRSKLVYSLDALRVFLDRPLLGAGGGGWAVLYTRYQSYGYTTRNVHNHYLQAAVEVGAAGLGLWLAMGVWAVWLAFRCLGRAGGRRDGRSQGGGARSSCLLAGLGAAVLAVMAHVTLDFALSFPAMAIWFWTYVGLAGGLVAGEAGGSGPGAGSGAGSGAGFGSGSGEGARPPGRPAASGAVASVTSLVAVVILVAAVGLCLSFLYAIGQAGIARDLASRNPEEALAAYGRAAAADPFNPEWRLDRARLLRDLGEPAAAVAELTSAMTLSPTDEYRIPLGQALESLPASEASLGQVADFWDAAATQVPFRLEYWEHLAQDLARLAALESEEQAAKTAERILALPGRMASVNARVPAWVPAVRSLDLSSEVLVLARAQALAILGRPDEARRLADTVSLARPASPGRDLPPPPVPPERLVLVDFAVGTSPTAMVRSARAAGAVAAWPANVSAGRYYLETRGGLDVQAALGCLLLDPAVTAISPVR